MDSLINGGIKITFKIYHERAYCDAYITVIDMKYGHHALKFNGLFRCIERALVSSLKAT
jgi:hypothetical protein